MSPVRCDFSLHMKMFRFVHSGVVPWKSSHARCWDSWYRLYLFMCVCIIYKHTCGNIISRLWLGFISTCREYRAEQNNRLIYLKSFFRASHFTQQPSWQLFSCHARLASSCFNGIKTKTTKTVCQITNANPVQLMQNVF